MEEIANEALCVCGHEAQDHHQSFLPSGYMLIEECEYYGWNEQGGAMQNDDGHWVAHCMKFKLAKEANHGPRTCSEN